MIIGRNGERRGPPRYKPEEDTPRERPKPDEDPSITRVIHRTKGQTAIRYSSEPVYPGYDRSITVTKYDTPRDSAEVIRFNEAVLAEHTAFAKEGEVTLGNLLRGETNFNTAKLGHFSLAKNPAYHRHLLTQHPSGEYVRGISKKFDTGRDLEWLGKNFPDERFKFYQSFDLSSPEKEATAQTYMSEVIEECVQRKITLAVKTYDHDYDSCILYTHDREALEEVLRAKYKKYRTTGLFASARRYFQAPISDIDPTHIAWVQESLDAKHSHSTRMGKLGDALEAGKSFEEACDEAGVRPEAPWLNKENN
jgi:hypothetical protein